MLLIISLITKAQDTIYLKNNTSITVKIAEVGIGEIKYKHFNNLTGPTYAVLKNDVRYIKYLNGAVDVISLIDSYSQPTPNLLKKNNSNDLYVSVGSHIGFMYLIADMEQIPFHIHIDKKVSGKFFMGLGYSRDVYEGSAIRNNYRLRLYSYFNDENKKLVGFAGGSLGVSRWKNQTDRPSFTLPSVQAFIGFKANITPSIFNQTEISVGSPYAIQTSFGFKF